MFIPKGLQRRISKGGGKTKEQGDVKFRLSQHLRPNFHSWQCIYRPSDFTTKIKPI